jgi:hypothetical protein
MKKLVLVTFFAFAAVLVAASTAGVRAQGAPAPSPTPMDQHIYSDLGMDFVAPPGALLAARRAVRVAALGEDLEPVAIWALDAGKPNVRILKIEMESFTGPPSQWEGQFESQMHNSGDGVLIKKKTPMSLTNGMPASFVEITYGNGFDARKEFAVVFADGMRGIAITMVGRVGEINAEDAMAAMQNAKAVRYPIDREAAPPQ